MPKEIIKITKTQEIMYEVDRSQYPPELQDVSFEQIRQFELKNQKENDCSEVWDNVPDEFTVEIIKE